MLILTILGFFMCGFPTTNQDMDKIQNPECFSIVDDAEDLFDIKIPDTPYIITKDFSLENNRGTIKVHFDNETNEKFNKTITKNRYTLDSEKLNSLLDTYNFEEIESDEVGMIYNYTREKYNVASTNDSPFPLLNSTNSFILLVYNYKDNVLFIYVNTRYR